jgi:hypothetical protein
MGYFDDFGKELRNKGKEYIATFKLSNSFGVLPRDLMVLEPNELNFTHTYSFKAESHQEALEIAKSKLEAIASEVSGLEISLEKLTVTNNIDVSSIKPIKVIKA